MSKILLCILFITINVKSFSKTSKIPFDNSTNIAIDLTHPDYGNLYPEELEEMRDLGEDISLYEPRLNDLYVGHDTSKDREKDQSVEASVDQTFSFVDTIKSPNGMMRFNVKDAKGKLFQVTLSKRLHTQILRKNIFRKLGYKIPASKWLSGIKLSFKDNEQRDFFKGLQIFASTSLSSDRWVREVSDKELYIQDLLIKDRSVINQTDLSVSAYNETYERRSLRSTLIPYSFVALNESINAFSRTMTRLFDGNYVFKHFQEETVFNASLDDVNWISRKLAKLSFDDIKDVVDYAHFPEPVDAIILEKLIYRRNHLLKTLLLKYEPLAVPEIKHKRYKNGFLKKIEFPYYATDFTSDRMESPFDDLLTFGIAKGQESLISGSVKKINSYISAFNLSEKRSQWVKEDFLKHKDYAVDYFVENGKFPTLPFDKWISPTLNAGLILGRDVVIGPSLGTDNLVQMADSFGYYYSYGAHVGLERIFEKNISGSFSMNKQFMVNFSHVKPLNKIKDVFDTDYKNILVGIYKKKLQARLNDAVNTSQDEEEERKKVAQEVMDYFDKEFKSGESLIISENSIPGLNASVSIPVFNMFTAKGSFGHKTKELKRIHVYRRNKDTFQVYFDDAELREMIYRGRLSYLIPIIDYEGKSLSGSYGVKVFNFNLDRNLKRNPDFFKNAKALLSIMDKRTLSEVDQEPLTILSTVSDKLNQLNLLFLTNKRLKKYSDLYITKEEHDDSKFMYSSYGNQRGLNYADLAKRVFNYVVAEFISEIELFLTPDAHQEPYKTIFGSSDTVNTEFHAKYQDLDKSGFNNLSNKYIVSSFIDEGNSLSTRKLKSKLKKVNEDMGLTIYEDGDYKDMGKLKLYKIETKVHLYDLAVDRVFHLNSRDIDKLASMIKENVNPYSCNKASTIGKKLRCGDFTYLKYIKKQCDEFYDKGNFLKGNKCISRFAYYLMRYNDIKNIIDLVGLENIFVESSVNGFREDKETIYRPLKGNTYGRINSTHKDGPFNSLVSFLGVLKGELGGSWLRYRL